MNSNGIHLVLALAAFFSPYLFLPAVLTGIFSRSWRHMLLFDGALIFVLTLIVFDNSPSAALVIICMAAALMWSAVVFGFRQYLADGPST